MHNSLNDFLNALLLMSSWEILAALLGVVYVVLAAKESLWAWFFGFLSTFIYTIIFWEGALLSSSFLNFYYMVMAVYGYYAWKNGSGEKKLKITTFSLSKNLQIITVGMLLSLVMGYLSTTYTDAKLAYMDALVMVFSIIATWLLTQKVLENWLYWLVIDTIAIVLYWHTGYLATVILFVIYIVLALYGYVTWRGAFRPINVKHYKLLANQTVEELSLLDQQGHCNINYYLKTDKARYVVRKFKHQSDREAEFFIQNLAHKQGIAGKAFYLDEEKELMFCEYVEGEHYYKLNQQTLKKLALVLQKLHKIKLQQRPTTFKSSFKYKDKKVYEAYSVLNRFKPDYVLAHNDLHPKNILFGEKIQLIDWEYAGVSDRYFDLAAIILEFKLNAKDEKSFLRAYFPARKVPNYKKLEAYKTIYKTLWTVWFYKLERGKIATISK